MKKLFVTLMAIAFCATALKAQDIRLNTYAGYVFDDAVDSYFDPTNYYKGRVNGGFLWGGGIEVRTQREDYGVELLYLRQDTKAPMNYFQNGIKFTNFDLAVNHIMVAGNRYFGPKDSKIEGYGGAMVGLTVLGLKNPDNGRSSTKTKLGLGVRLGANIWVTEKVGLKVQTQLISVVQSVGGGFYFGSGGSGVGLASYSSVYQFGLGGGLVFKISPDKKGSKK
jgi:hypothetical protein